MLSKLRKDFLNWKPDSEAFSNEGLTVADNVLHDTAGYKAIKAQSGGAFQLTEFYVGQTLASVRSMQIRAIGDRKNFVAAIAQDAVTSAAMGHLSIGAEGDSTAFAVATTAALASAGSVRVKSFSVAELGVGAFVACASFSAELATGSSTVYSITGDITYTVLSV